ncbi:hypothetical protein [Psychrobacillus sp. BL-248-WT-3]|uniref:hypothetical protein n=1 Tax=Psychrobacillus sp. BL-248-WT-3 TaxID=2725306 RepID=UPI00146AE4ED|nr:hypothetical protein [Psychrobacillus sp. BL-248-WT-3]NME07380.1 hypothetical protein [Psychrobacillus sp. BL-248-WT-3]
MNIRLLTSMLLAKASSVRQGFAPSVQGSSSFPPGLIPSPQGSSSFLQGSAPSPQGYLAFLKKLPFIRSPLH